MKLFPIFIVHLLPQLQTLLMIYLSFLFFTCCEQQSSEKKTQENNIARLKKEVLDIHDFAMMHIDDLISKRIKLKRLLEEKVNKNDNDTIALSNKVQQLEEANKDMFLWMSNYKHDSVFLNLQHQTEYYRVQKKLVSKVATDIDDLLSENN